MAILAQSFKSLIESSLGHCKWSIAMIPPMREKLFDKFNLFDAHEAFERVVILKLNCIFRSSSFHIESFLFEIRVLIHMIICLGKRSFFEYLTAVFE